MKSEFQPWHCDHWGLSAWKDEVVSSGTSLYPVSVCSETVNYTWVDLGPVLKKKTDIRGHALA